MIKCKTSTARWGWAGPGGDESTRQGRVVDGANGTGLAGFSWVGGQEAVRRPGWANK
jgi:hypothetical protein